jgi:hypothetical protein
MIYLNVSCLLIWHDFIFRRKSIRKDLSNVEGLEDFSNVTILILSILTMLGAVVTIIPFNIIKSIKRLL